MTSVTHYPWAERLLHRIAFRGQAIQLSLADMEQWLFHIDNSQPITRPVFITALPRAGTTLLLEILSQLPELVTHTYRQMPFVMCPLLWSRISAPFRKDATLKERAHGDGMKVGFDSPEAFEEILWKAFWQNHYHQDAIMSWQATEENDAFFSFFTSHMRTLLTLYRQQHGSDAPDELHYLSKNNANIARLPLLAQRFPDSLILLPVRDPWQHATSMMRQHQRFSEIHQHDSFALSYMRWLGHHEFGQALLPLHFSAQDQPLAGLDPQQLPFWLTYWCNAYQAVLAQLPANVYLVNYEDLCSSPLPVLEALAAHLKTSHPNILLEQASRLHCPPHYPLDTAVPAPLNRQVQQIYNQLLSHAQMLAAA